MKQQALPLVVFIAVLLSIYALPQVQSSRKPGGSCAQSIVIQMLPGKMAPTYIVQGKHYDAYPLDVLNAATVACPNLKEIDILVDPSNSAHDLLVAYGAAKKSQFEQIHFFVAGPSSYFPFSFGESTAKPQDK